MKLRPTTDFHDKLQHFIFECHWPVLPALIQRIPALVDLQKRQMPEVFTFVFIRLKVVISSHKIS